MAFATLALSELALVYGMRSRTVAAWRLPPNGWLNLSVFLSFLVVVAAVYTPGGDAVFATVPLDPVDAATVALLALVPLAAIELLKSRSRRSRKGEAS
jgi:magnesium-transporting ATPase (P-type)